MFRIVLVRFSIYVCVFMTVLSLLEIKTPVLAGVLSWFVKKKFRSKFEAKSNYQLFLVLRKPHQVSISRIIRSLQSCQ